MNKENIVLPPEQKKAIQDGMQQVWDRVAYDLVSEVGEISDEEVFDVVCDYFDYRDKDTIELMRNLPHEQLWDIFKEKFRFDTYGM